MPKQAWKTQRSSSLRAATDAASVAKRLRRASDSTTAATLSGDKQHSYGAASSGHEVQHVSDDAARQHASDGATAAQRASNADSSSSGTCTALRLSKLQQRRERLESAARQLTLLIRRELAAFKPSAGLDASAHARRAQEVASLQGHDNPQFHDPVSGKLRRARDLAASTVFDALAAQLPSVPAAQILRALMHSSGKCAYATVQLWNSDWVRKRITDNNWVGALKRMAAHVEQGGVVQAQEVCPDEPASNIIKPLSCGVDYVHYRPAISVGFEPQLVQHLRRLARRPWSPMGGERLDRAIGYCMQHGRMPSPEVDRLHLPFEYGRFEDDTD